MNNESPIRLPGIIEFTLEDLESNRHGYTTERQKRKVLQHLSWQLIKALLGSSLLTLIVLALTVALGSWPEILSSKVVDLGQWRVLLPFGILMWLILFIAQLTNSPYVYWEEVYAMRDLALNSVNSVTGRPYFRTEERQVTNPRYRGYFRLPTTEVVHYMFRLGGSFEFVVPEKLEYTLDKRKYYRLYHLTRSRIILSIEEISETH